MCAFPAAPPPVFMRTRTCACPLPLIPFSHTPEHPFPACCPRTGRFVDAVVKDDLPATAEVAPEDDLPVVGAGREVRPKARVRPRDLPHGPVVLAQRLDQPLVAGLHLEHPHGLVRRARRQPASIVVQLRIVLRMRSCKLRLHRQQARALSSARAAASPHVRSCPDDPSRTR